jgi:hypothetical protein
MDCYDPEDGSWEVFRKPVITYQTTRRYIPIDVKLSDTKKVRYHMDTTAARAQALLHLL